ncbi:MAG: indolepyruvate oxidoreductase subunit beta family protein [Alphaproteobacteria bacterium]|nr:indolepyruvate oxidoreductase subunit beta family protein [Alphaproteobacteria bacterium]
MSSTENTFQAVAGQDQTKNIIKLAILAVGGQGGGVLSDWIVDVAERNGYRAQATSVPGVAQRTGATIYYIEMMPDSDRDPVFALMPAPGDVDILIAAEIMEAGRAINRGLVSADRTTLISSSHRMFAVSEKIVPGDGRADSAVVLAAGQEAAKAFVCFAMDKIATETKSHISSCLLGALAGSKALPFSAESYRETIRASGRGVSASLKAFDRALERAETGGEVPAVIPESMTQPTNLSGPKTLMDKYNSLVNRIHALPEPAHDIAKRGLQKVVDFQDLAYGADYLDQLEHAATADRQAGGEHHHFRYTTEMAKYLANAMAYDDVIRVADLKTRGTRFERVRREMDVDAETVMQITEFMHPRATEFCGLMPHRIGRFVQDRPKLVALLDRLVNRGRRVRTDAVLPFMSLYLVSGLRRWRRVLLRHHIERAHWQAWQTRAQATLATDYALAVEIILCRRLVKGYSDTHSRGLSKFDRVLAGGDLVAGRSDAADWLRRLREAALLDEKGEALDGALATIHSFIDDTPKAASA